MGQLKIAQVSGLKPALDTKADTVTNLGNAGVGLFYQKVGTELQFNKINAGNGMVTFVANNGVINITVDTGTTANKLVQLDSQGRIPAINGSLLTNINPANIAGTPGALPLTNLLLPVGQFYVGNASNNPTSIAKSAIPLSGFGVPTSGIDIGVQKITTSASSWASNELVPKSYVDSAVQGNVYKPAARMASKANVNILAPGQTVDGITAVIDDRIVLLGQTASEQNGVYLYKGGGNAMVRAADCDTAAELLNMAIYIESGTYAYQSYKLLTQNPITVDTTALLYTQIGGAAEIIAGDGLNRANGNTFVVVGDGVTIGIVNSKVSVVSSAVGGQVLISAGSPTQTPSWGALDLANVNATTGALAVTRGGSGLVSVPQHTILGAINAANVVAALAMNTNSILGRKAGNIASLAKADVREILNIRPKNDRANAVNGAMKLITLSQTADDATQVLIFYNGQLLDYNVDYTISGLDVTATNAFNQRMGGSGADGLGFSSGSLDSISAVYIY